jgi:predicted RNA-binding protein with PUA domain
MAKVSFDLDAMKAQFAARGGKVAVVKSGVRAIESDRTIYAAMREGKRAQADAVRESRASESRHETMVGAYHAARAMGWSYENAMEYAATAVD